LSCGESGGLKSSRRNSSGSLAKFAAVRTAQH
jgi:hypothetical protein